MIEAAVQKGESLTRRLLAFSRRQSLAPEVIDLPERVRKILSVLEQSTRANIDISIRSAPETIVVKVDPDELEIALLNLSLNARDAMPDGGRIEIIVGIASPDDDGSAMGASMAFIDFTDTGSGIPEAIRERVFEPFFTTKTVDKGTGLGLSQVYGFVKQSDGTITVSSDPGVRTTFRLLLPICPDAPAPKQSEIPDGQPARLRHATVLLVEDHPDVGS
jgi:two-component system, NtrC family, sensor kinase